MSTDTASVELVGEETVENVARAALLAALTGAFAYVSFPNPFSPAPVSLQVLGVFLAGILLGPVWGGVSMALYLVAGAVGAPIFAGGSAGVGALLGPTGGYLWSYPVAAFAIGAVVHGGLRLRNPVPRGIPRLVGAMVVGTVVIYAFGVVGFSLVLNMTLKKAFLTAAVAFVPAEAFKMAAAIGVVRSDQIAAE
ncbi:biotin transporter BioY [Halorussus salinisoli]|uniref:biotin transporter BioY n=1 Tax=Halorussus salinisoli TaxID=2558242 RepID=UPI0010C234C7|nr:biotin transporter BioY [Halorussus salinisoli]